MTLLVKPFHGVFVVHWDTFLCLIRTWNRQRWRSTITCCHTDLTPAPIRAAFLCIRKSSLVEKELVAGYLGNVNIKFNAARIAAACLCSLASACRRPSYALTASAARKGDDVARHSRASHATTHRAHKQQNDASSSWQAQAVPGYYSDVDRRRRSSENTGVFRPSMISAEGIMIVKTPTDVPPLP